MSQRLLLPLVIELTVGQQAVFADIADELARTDSKSSRLAPAALRSGRRRIECPHRRACSELLDQFFRGGAGLLRSSIACHAAIKVNMPLGDQVGWCWDSPRQNCP